MRRSARKLFHIAAGVLLAAGSSNLTARETAGPVAAMAVPPAPPPSAAQAAVGSDIALSGVLEQGGWARGTAPAGTRTLSFEGTPLALAADGAFFIAFDRDAGPSASLVATLADGRTVRREIAVAPRAWAIERVNVPMKPPTLPSEAFLRIRKGELAQIEAARAMRTGAGGWRETFVWPVVGRISGRFGAQRIYQGVAGSYHSGTDIASPTGTPIVAPADGVVILAAPMPFTLEGHLLMIDHGMGLNSAFLHCSELEVKAGDHVKQGQLIARVGMTGRATGPHLHWSLKWNAARLDPSLFAGAMP